MNKTLKWILIIAIPLIIFLVVAKSQGWIGKDDTTEVETEKVEKIDIVETVIASGKIQPEVEVKISSEVSGEIIQLPIEEGQKVKKGDLLVEINPDIYKAAVNRALAAVNSSRASLSSAKAQLIEAEKNYNRNKKLYSQKVISDAEFDGFQRAYDVAKLTVEGSEFQLASSQATYKEAKDNLQRTTIYSPQDGTISVLNVEVGERVVGTAQMTGTEILRVADLENMEVLVEVNENDIIRVDLNDTAIIEVDAYLDTEFKGVVTEIANSAKLTQGMSTDQVTNFEVKVRILKASYKDVLKEGEASPFRPGMTASVEVQTEARKGILGLPIEAITTRSDTSRNAKSYKNRIKSDEEDEAFEVVFLYVDGEAQIQVVKTGIQDDENIEVVEGLEEGQTIIKGPYSQVSKKLVNGEKVAAKGDDKKKRKGKKKEEATEEE